MNYTPRLILERLYGLGLMVTAAEGKLHLSGDAQPPPELLEAIKAHKPALLVLLASLPTFTPKDERRLADWYCQQPRERRLAIHRRGVALRREKSWPFYAADLDASREAWEAAGNRAGADKVSLHAK